MARRSAVSQLCYLLTVAAALAILVWGLMEVMRKRQHHESSETEVISRQLRGFGALVLSEFVLLVGSGLCMWLAGGLAMAGRSLRM